jgi:gamma-glutamyltranspeptidase/glutathione hydrolase
MSETIEGDRGMVVAPHRAAAEAGAEVLRAGGNALEAMIAAAATITVVYPHMNGIGGDNFFLIAEPGKPPRAIMSAGAAGSLATIERYARKGYDRIPWRGSDAALTVAGAVAGWHLALEIAEALGGRISRRDLLADAVGRAREGIIVCRSQHRMTTESLDVLAPVFGFARHWLVDGKPPQEGAVIRQVRLADTLEQLVHAGFGDFYRGDVAAEIAADLEEAGAPVTRADLAKHEARLAKPLRVALADGTLFSTPPPTQGLVTLMTLALFDRLGVARGESFEHFHGLIEASKRAIHVRNRAITDPAYGEDVEAYLEAAWLDGDAAVIDKKRAAPFGEKSGSGDTVWLGAIDKNGLAVSFIQSLFFDFGSGVVLPRTGITWHNRGSSFSLDPASSNPLMPGRLPFHTLNAPLLRFNDGRVMSLGTMGGEGQPQYLAQFLTRYRFGMALGDALEAPRFLLGTTWGRRGVGLSVESRFDPDLIAALERAGHSVNVLAEPFIDMMGHAGAIVRRPDGRMFGAADPRSDGAAVIG